MTLIRCNKFRNIRIAYIWKKPLFRTNDLYNDNRYPAVPTIHSKYNTNNKCLKNYPYCIFYVFYIFIYILIFGFIKFNHYGSLNVYKFILYILCMYVLLIKAECRLLFTINKYSQQLCTLYPSSKLFEITKNRACSLV